MKFFKHILVLAGLLSATTAMADSPFIWGGSYAKNLAPLGIQHFNGMYVRTLTVDPSAGGGVTAPVGSLGQRNNAGVGETWLKTGAADTSWTKVSTSTATGDVVGPASATDNAIARFDGVTGKLIQNSTPTINDAGAIDMGSNKITSVTDPTSAQDAATKAYVDSQLLQLNPADAVYAASTANIAGTYTNLVSGICIGDTFTVTATGALSLDGVSPPLGSRVLLKNQTSSFQGGVWTVTVAGSLGVSPVLTRALDFDSASNMSSGQIIPIINGTVNAGASYFQTATISTCNTDAQTWTQFQKAASAYASSVLTSAHLYVGNASNVATDVAASGDVTLANTGAFTIANLAVTNAKIANSTIDLTTKVTGILPVANGGTNSNTALNNNRVMQSSGGAVVEAAAITASRALVSDANGIPVASATTATELGYVSGVTSAIQTQLGTKWSVTGNSGLTAGTNFIGTTDAVDTVFKRNSIEEFRLGNNLLQFMDSSGQPWKMFPGSSNWQFTNSAALHIGFALDLNNRFYIYDTSPRYFTMFSSAGDSGTDPGNPVTAVGTPILEIQNKDTTVGNYSAVGFSNAATAGTAHPISSMIAGKNDNHSSGGSQTGHLELWTWNAGTGVKSLNIAADGTITAVKYGTGILHSSSTGVISSSAVDLSSADATGTMAAGRMPALTGDVTNSAGSLATTIANLAVTNAKIANATIDLTTKVTGVLPVANGGTGQSSYTDGQLLIGNSSGNTLTKATLTQGTGITITNGNGTITIAASGGSGNVSSGASSGSREELFVIGGSSANNNCDGTNCALFNNSGGATAISRTSAGIMDITLTSTSCASAWSCQFTAEDQQNANPLFCSRYGAGGNPSTTHFFVRCVDSTGTSQNTNASVRCGCNK